MVVVTGAAVVGTGADVVGGGAGVVVATGAAVVGGAAVVDEAASFALVAVLLQAPITHAKATVPAAMSPILALFIACAPLVSIGIGGGGVGHPSPISRVDCIMQISRLSLLCSNGHTTRTA